MKNKISKEEETLSKFKILSSDPQRSTSQYLIDTLDDLKILPANQPGSAALVADTSDVYVLNNKNQWVKL